MLLVALFAGGRPFLHIGMATFAGLVSPVLAETFNFAEAFFMALLAVADSSLMSLVVELHISLHLDYISAESCACECS